MSKALRIMLCLLLIAGILAGCGANSEVADTSSKNEISSTEETFETIDTADTIVAVDSEAASSIIEPVLDRASKPVTKKPYTIMVYIIGSNLESQNGAASTDITEMMNSGVDSDKVNVVIYTGGALSWTTNISNRCNSVYELDDGVFSLAGTTSGNVNMGSAETFSNFLNYAYENYPADNYGLICWDHGSGPVLGYGMDELFDDDQLSLAETAKGLSRSPFGADEKLAFIGYDACLMASLEVAALWSDYADYLIASAETETGDGWDYSFLSTLNRTQDTLQIADSILDSYFDYVDDMNLLYGLVGISGHVDATLSCVELSGIPKVVDAFNDLAEAMNQAVKDGKYSKIAQIRSGLKDYGQSSSDAYDIVDLGDMTIQMSKIFEKQTKTLANAIDGTIKMSGSNVDDCWGLTVYFPYYDAAGIFTNQNIYYTGCSTEYLTEYCPSEYAAFLNAFTDIRFGTTSSRSSLLGDVQSSQKKITMELTEEQLENLSQATYTVLWESEDGVYTPVKSDCVIEPDESGALEISADQSLICAGNGWEQIPWSVAYTEANRFHSVNTRVYGDLQNISGGTTSDKSIVVDLYVNDDDVTIESISEVNDELFAGGKQDVQTEVWDNLGYTFKRYEPGHNSDGDMTPYTDWEDDGWAMICYIAFDEALEFSCVPVTQLMGNYACQFVLEDIYGNKYASELFEIPSAGNSETVTCATENGELSFEVFDGEAALVSYTGTDTELVVPQNVNGATVTEVCSGAFSYSNQVVLESVVLPDTVRYIHHGAFNYCDTLLEITLPADLMHIEAGAFYDCRSMKAYSISDTNANYKVVDGVVFSKDGRQLVAYPAGKAGAYAVPDDVEYIGAYAFFGSEGLTEVKLPDGLKVIDNYAFFNCAGFEKLEFPASLERIGAYAFGVYTDWMYFNDTLPDNAKTLAQIEVISIGANVSSIGHGAFGGIANTRFEVDQANRHYAAVDGFLTNAAGDSLVAVPLGLRGEVQIPEQITAILSNAFQLGGNSEITAIVLPEGLIGIQKDAIVASYTADKLELKCKAGSNAETYARENNLKCTTY